ncbi:hypothetical protein [Staphylococcus xylosus]|nr:hypothetical protein [Staphylococcus xylosus]
MFKISEETKRKILEAIFVIENDNRRPNKEIKLKNRNIFQKISIF